MSQRKNLLYNSINNPTIYKIIQKVMSGTSFRADIIKRNIKKRNLKILDIGCGPAEILKVIPHCEYYGYDIDSRSINYAKKRYKKKNYHFFCKKFDEKEIKKLPTFDCIVFFGLLHHLENKEINKLLRLCKKKMKKGSKLLTEDPVIINNQNIIAKYLILKDRGKNVRRKKQYIKLLKTHFNIVTSKITHQAFIPYTWFTTVCKK
jgi:2-polyprenyl-3-methyl-5-hydroxy-6-metoxy-1,4-benzoquinol methylase